ncbi:hypothetical protein [Actinophytocola oryzae]|nr:hypothetical protein [Actinophytocola oryzae]
MPRLTFEEPRGGPRAKAAQSGQPADQAKDPGQQPDPRSPGAQAPEPAAQPAPADRHAEPDFAWLRPRTQPPADSPATPPTRPEPSDTRAEEPAPAEQADGWPVEASRLTDAPVGPAAEERPRPVELSFRRAGAPVRWVESDEPEGPEESHSSTLLPLAQLVGQARPQTAAPVDPPVAEAEPEANETEKFAELFVAPSDDEDQSSGRHRRSATRDTVLVVLKVATVAVAIALVGAVVLLATSGEDDGRTKAPSVPQIATSDDRSAAPTTTDVGAIVAPEVRSQTTQIVPPPVTTTTTQPSVPSGQPSSPQNQFVRVGDPCDTQGAYAFTERFEPVVCDRGRGGGQLTWRRVFR